MDYQENKSINHKPFKAHFGRRGLRSVLNIVFSGGKVDDERADESEEHGCCGIQSGSFVKDINPKTHEEASKKEQPFRCLKWEQHQKEDVQVRVDILSETDIIKHQHLKQQQSDESESVKYQWVAHSESISSIKLFFTTYTWRRVLKLVASLSLARLKTSLSDFR